jgi:hypothetical protein
MENNMGIQSVDKDGNPVLIYKTSKYYYHNSPEFRERVKAKNRENYHKNKTVNAEKDNERTRIINKNKYHDNPEYKEKKKAESRARYYANKAKKAEQSNAQSSL